MKLFIQLSVTSFLFAMSLVSCAPETSKDDPIGTGQGKIKDMGLSQDSASATKTVTYAAEEK